MGFEDLDAIHKGTVKVLLLAGLFSALFFAPSFKRWLKQVIALSLPTAVGMALSFTIGMVAALSAEPQIATSTFSPRQVGQSWAAFFAVAALIWTELTAIYAGSFTLGYVVGYLPRSLGWLYRRAFAARS